MNKKLITLLLIIGIFFIWQRYSAPLLTSEETGAELWKTFSDTRTGLVFEYPEQLNTEYIHPTEWPPKIELSAQPFVCKESGNETTAGGRTKEKMIDTRIYCITKLSEGAAGSTYTTYKHKFPHDMAETITLTFTLRYPQCDNYDDPNKTTCKEERSSFDIDSLVDQIAFTIRKI